VGNCNIANFRSAVPTCTENNLKVLDSVLDANERMPGVEIIAHNHVKALTKDYKKREKAKKSRELL